MWVGWRRLSTESAVVGEKGLSLADDAFDSRRRSPIVPLLLDMRDAEKH